MSSCIEVLSPWVWEAYTATRQQQARRRRQWGHTLCAISRCAALLSIPSVGGLHHFRMRNRCPHIWAIQHGPFCTCLSQSKLLNPPFRCGWYGGWGWGEMFLVRFPSSQLFVFILQKQNIQNLLTVCTVHLSYSFVRALICRHKHDVGTSRAVNPP